MEPAPLTSIDRRTFLVGGARVLALAPCMGALARSVDSAEERALVVVQLSGGNDGLDTVVPHRQDTYHRLRPLLGHARSALHRFDDEHGLHPGLDGLAGLAADGLVAVLHGIGTPAPDRSHFHSLEAWHTSQHGGTPGRVGWLGHLADQLAQRAPGSLPALAIGAGELPRSMRGEEVLPPSLSDERGLVLLPAAERLAAPRAALARPRPGERGELAFLRDAARTSYDAAARMQRLAEAPARVEYPDRPLARDLRLVARLIAGGFGARLFHVGLDGFDTHSTQASTRAALLDELDGALTAFQRDLAAAGVAGRVVTFVFSEFGRRAAENGSRGTDHGHGGPALVLGPGVVPGGHGAAPDLARLVDGDVPATTDFRGVQRRLAREWLGLAPLVDVEVTAPRFLA